MSQFFKPALRVLAGTALATGLIAGTASAATVSVTITNNQDTGGLYLTPLLSIFHDGSYDTFSPGSNASAALEALAEEGDVSGVIADVDAQGAGFVTGVLANPAGFSGAPVLDPGESASIQIDLDTVNNRFFSYLSMVIPSNDTFIGNGNPTAYELFNAMGDFVGTSPIVIGVDDAWDGGTEADNGNGAAFAPATAMGATDTMDGVSALANLDFLIGRPQAPGGTVLSASGPLATISFAEIAPVPLPAGLPLILAGMGAFGTLRLRSRKG